MPKGYWIPHIDVSDPEGYKAYMAATPAAHEKYGGRALVRGGTQEVVEGKGRSRNVLREFPDYATALGCYRSAEYQRAKPLRLAHSTCDFVIVEGYDGVQPHPAKAPPPAAMRKGYWIVHADVSDPEGYKAYMAADMVPLGNLARTSSCAAAPMKWSKAKFARARSGSNFRATAQRSNAMGPPTIKPQPRCAKAKPNLISSSLKDVRPRHSALPAPGGAGAGALLSFAFVARYTGGNSCPEISSCRTCGWS